MGNCGSGTTKEVQRSRVLLLGAGGAGKSTLFKQVKLITSLSGFDQGLRNDSIVPIYQNMIDACQKLVKICLKNELELPPDVMSAADRIRSLNIQSPQDTESVQALKVAANTIWNNGEIKKAFKLSIIETSSKDAMNANDDYFLGQIDTVCDPAYSPSDNDLLMMRRSTSGAHSLDFAFDPIQFKMPGKLSYWTLTDVGGQIHERATWYEEFNDLDGLIFVLSLPDFDQTSQDNRSANKLVEDGVNLMLQVMRADNLQGVPVCVLLNKKDLFIRKIAANPTVGIKEVFPEYEGKTNSHGESIQFIQNFIDQEISKETNVSKTFYVTTATDTEIVKNILGKVVENITNQNLQHAGLI
ncbi:hypothetical protein TrLO_g5623 [Triparma laevis f. longispina]|uniref:Uncharacterized protein n=2 Tax=Triparma laevis TaxID=1534972 RepID=A0A9W7CH00_9STRA|nr:hypothetical protein TrLO_g5623 [Triparma laevis f. longispina]